MGSLGNPSAMKHTLALLTSLLLVRLAAPEASCAASAIHAENCEAARARAKVSDSDLVVFQRGSDWNQLGETLYRKVWLTDELARALGDRFVLVAVDRPETVGTCTANFIFGNVLSWGAKRFAGQPKTAQSYAKAMESFFNAKGGSLNKNLLASTLQMGVRKAAESGDLVSFSLWTDMAEKMLPALKPGDVHLTPKQAAAFPRITPFPGELISQGGLLQTCSVHADDRPLSYERILRGTGFGGWFDTASDKKPWAQVHLPGEGDLTGIVLVGRYEYPPNHETYKEAPLKVSVSLDNKTWTDVATFDKDETVFRVDLQCQDLKARYVRVERVPTAPDARPFERFNLRSVLVYGKKLN